MNTKSPPSKKHETTNIHVFSKFSSSQTEQLNSHIGLYSQKGFPLLFQQ